MGIRTAAIVMTNYTEVQAGITGGFVRNQYEVQSQTAVEFQANNTGLLEEIESRATDCNRNFN